MNFHKLLTLTLFTAAVSCGESVKEHSFSFDSSVLQEQYHRSETVKLAVLNPKNATIDSIVYYVNDKRVGAVKNAGSQEFPLSEAKLGYQALRAMVFTGGESAEISDRIEVVSEIQPKLLEFEVVNMYAHDIQSFTQGLEFYRDTLYEGTGRNGQSYIRKYDYKTGKVYKQVDLDAKYFGEGITIMDDKIYQLPISLR